MLRIALIDILLFLLPFLVYAAYMVWVKGATPASVLQNGPVLWLLTAGLGLLFVVMATLVQFSGGERGGTYHPPVIVDGKIEPGGID